MKQKFISILGSAIALSLILLFINGCKKNTETIAEPVKVNKSVIVEDPLIAAAKDFFKKNILNGNLTFNGTPNLRQQLKKTPVWEKAYIGKLTTGDAVIVPLKFDKALSCKTNFDSTLSLQKQTKLFIKKNASGNFTAEVVTIFPDKATMTHSATSFSGVVLVEDWTGNTIHKYVNGKTALKAAANSPTQRITDDGCYHINWYLCDIDENGTYSNCTFAFSEDVGSCGNYFVDNQDENTYVEYAVNKTTQWQIYNDAGNGNSNWIITSTESIQDTKNNVEASGGHFIDMSHSGDQLIGTAFHFHKGTPGWNKVISSDKHTIGCTLWGYVSWDAGEDFNLPAWSTNTSAS